MEKPYKVVLEVTLDITAKDRDHAIKIARQWEGETECYGISVKDGGYSTQWISKQKVKSARQNRKVRCLS